MTDTVQLLSWRFGGPLARVSPALAWTILGAIGVVGLVWIIVSYRRTLVALSPVRRNSLTALRIALWATILVALAGPTRVERTFAHKEIRPLALVLDRSDSMTATDNRGQRRSDDSLRRWRALAPSARKTFGEPKTFAFADKLSAVPSLDDVADARSGARIETATTRLFTSLQSTLAEAPPGGWGAVVVLTDGLDTSVDNKAAPAALDTTVRSALNAGTPIFTLAGHNRFSGKELLSLRDVTIPAQVPPRSKFSIELTLESFQPTARSVPLTLSVGGKTRPAEPLALAAGRRAFTWSTELTTDAPGVMPIELRIGEGTDAVVARAEVRIAKPDTTKILYYQGALDWGYRFLADILRRDPAFALTPIFNLAPTGSTRPRISPTGALPDLPSSASGLESYDVVVLANATAAQFSDEQQAALTAWVRSGGVLLFLAPDDDSTRGYAGSELERMLPVIFSEPRQAEKVDPTTANFRANMRRLGANNGMETTFALGAGERTVLPPLSAFKWDAGAASIIGADTVSAAPLFANYARVERAKPGAIVLARHPTEPGADGSGAILLALQRYGRGQSAVITSDALWRWKLNQPSKERGAELFWQNLLAWLARERPRGPRFEHAPLTSQTGTELTLRVLGGKTVRVTAGLEGGSPDAVATLISTGEQGGARLHTWTPPATGMWVFTATDSENRTARHWLTVGDTLLSGETSGAPPDEGVLQALARRTGGTMLDSSPPSAWTAPTKNVSNDLLREQRQPLWHAGWLLGGLLAIYATELLLRRRWQLL